MSEKEKYLEELFSKLFELLNTNYKDFNTLFPVGNKKEQLRELEEKYPELGLANYDKENEGVSLISLLATITDILCNKRFSVIVEDSSLKIIGCKLQQYSKLSKVEEG